MESKHGRWKIVSASGEIDLSNVAPFLSDLDKAVAESPSGFVVDLTEVTYMDSAGVQALLNAYVQAKRTGGSIAVVTTNEIVSSILQIINADRLPGFFICSDVGKAEQALDNAQASG